MGEDGGEIGEVLWEDIGVKFVFDLVTFSSEVIKITLKFRAGEPGSGASQRRNLGGGLGWLHKNFQIIESFHQCLPQ